MSNNMRRRDFLRGTSALAVGTALAGAAPTLRAQDERSYILTTATTGGTYYPVGVALATLIKVKLQPKQKIAMSAINSAGSGENVKLLRENQAQFAILQGLFGQWAWTGTGKVKADGPQKHMRSISMLWQNVEHFVVHNDYVKSGTIDDLQGLEGKKFSIGKRNSGTEGSGVTILGNLGYDVPNFFDLAYLGYGPSAEALQNGTIAGMNMPGGPPVGALSQAYASMKGEITALDFTDDQMQKANGEGRLWTRYIVEAGVYPGQSKDIQTIAQPNFLAVREDIDEDAVYLITKTVYENLPFLRNIHKATSAMKLEAALAGLPAPLHPGAAKYYEEAGLSIPAALMAG